MHFRIQTSNPDLKAIDVLRRGLRDLEAVCDLTLTTFTNEVNKT